MPGPGQGLPDERNDLPIGESEPGANLASLREACGRPCLARMFGPRANFPGGPVLLAGHTGMGPHCSLRGLGVLVDW